jgi:hypothetical protein
LVSSDTRDRGLDGIEGEGSLHATGAACTATTAAAAAAAGATSAATEAGRRTASTGSSRLREGVSRGQTQGESAESDE